MGPKQLEAPRSTARGGCAKDTHRMAKTEGLGAKHESPVPIEGQSSRRATTMVKQARNKNNAPTVI